jgi:hypothetical protein
LPRLQAGPAKVVAVQLRHLEDRAVVADPVPGDALDEVLDAVDHPRRAENAARAKGADARAEEPGETADVIDVRVAHEDVGDLVRHPRRQPPGIAEVEEQAAFPVAQPHVQEGVAEHPTDEGGPRPAHVARHRGAARVGGERRRGHLLGRSPGAHASADARGRLQQALRVAHGVADEEAGRRQRAVRRHPHRQHLACEADDLPQLHSPSGGVEEPRLPPDPRLRRIHRRRRS